jgi:competence protein ComFC
MPDALPILPARCYRCRQITEESSVCQKCRRQTKFAHVWVRSEYEGLAKDLIYRLKFERCSAAAVPIAELLAEALPWLPPDTVVTHIPTATSRHRQRGYDQAELLASQLAKKHDLRHAALLARIGQTRQVGAKREQRLLQLEQAFRIQSRHLVKNTSVLLIDDITTTGATIEAAASVLKNAGAKTINAAVFAQKQ